MKRKSFLGFPLAIAVIVLTGYPMLTLPEALAADAVASSPAVVQQPPVPTSPPRFTSGVRGFVHSDAGGPIGGAVVTASGEGGNHTAWTSPDGAYAIPLPAGRYDLTASARAHKDKQAPAVVLVGDNLSSQNLTLERTGPVLSGTVRDAKTGAALAGAVVEAHGGGSSNCPPGMACIQEARPELYRMPFATTTGRDGRYAMAVEAGAYKVHVYREGYRDAWGGGNEITADAREDFALEPIPPKSAVLEGRVVDAATGRPVPDAWVNAWPREPQARDATAEGGGSTGASGATDASGGTATASPSMTVVRPYDPYGHEGNSTQTDRDGRFRMGMYPGTYGFNVGAPGYGQHDETVTLADGETRSLDVRLEPIPGDTVTLRGAVVDRATGEPLQGAWVGVENQRWGHYNGSQTDESGRFELRTKPGWTLVWVRHEGGGYATPAKGAPPTTAEEPGFAAPEDTRPRPTSDRGYYPWVQSKSFAEGEAVDLRVTLEPKPKADARIVGYVLNGTTSQAIPGATVNVRNEDTGDWGWAQADKDGSFVLLGRPGVHTVHAYADGYYQNALVVRVAGPETRIDIALEHGRPQGYCCIAYATRADGSEAPPPSMAPAPGGASGAPASPGAAPSPAPPRTGESGFSNEDRNTATYQASGEGLGPYKAAGAPPPGTASPAAGAKGAPGFEALAVLGAVVAVAALAGRRFGRRSR